MIFFSPKQVLVTRSKGIREPVGHLAANRFPTPHHRIFKTSGFKAGRFCIMSKKDDNFQTFANPHKISYIHKINLLEAPYKLR
jgi:hypothetical protein